MTEVDENLLHSEPGSAVSEELSTHVLQERGPKGKGARRPRGVRHFTPSERTARGKGARRDVPRSTQSSSAVSESHAALNTVLAAWLYPGIS